MGGVKAHLVIGVVNHGGLPLALVVGVVNHWSFPGATARGSLAGGVRDLRSLPLSVHVLIPDGQEVHTDSYVTNGVVSQSVSSVCDVMI